MMGPDFTSVLAEKTLRRLVVALLLMYGAGVVGALFIQWLIRHLGINWK